MPPLCSFHTCRGLVLSTPGSIAFLPCLRLHVEVWYYPLQQPVASRRFARTQSDRFDMLRLALVLPSPCASRLPSRTQPEGLASSCRPSPVKIHDGLDKLNRRLASPLHPKVMSYITLRASHSFPLARPSSGLVHHQKSSRFLLGRCQHAVDTSHLLIQAVMQELRSDQLPRRPPLLQTITSHCTRLQVSSKSQSTFAIYRAPRSEFHGYV